MTDWLTGSYGADMGGSGAGIVAMRSTADGTLEAVGAMDATPSATWLLAHGDHLYAVIESETEGFVQSWRRVGGRLELDGRVTTGGTSACHLTMFHGRLIVTNYGDGVLGVVGLEASGAVAALLQAIPGPDVRGPHPDQGNSRQHASLVIDDATLVSVDLGADELQLHRLDGDEVVRYDSFALPKGTGPRDIARHPSGLIVVLGELDATMHLLSWNDGFTHLSTVQLPQVEREHAAAIAFSANGHFAYTSLRRSNRVAVVHIDVDAARLSFIDVVPGGGTWGRHLAVDGDLLHVANQLSNEVTTFRIGTDGVPVQLAPGTPLGSPAYLLPVDRGFDDGLVDPGGLIE
jgi:6-phosphogluconolactonase (cycloisomerase 2 family)